MAPERWTPRAVVRLGAWSCGAVPLKTYAILADTSTPLPPALIAAAQAVIAEAAPSVAATPHQNLGFVILHRGAEGVWLLLHWWLEGSICAELLWRSPLDGPVAFEPWGRPFMACVWELALIDHERRAFVRTVMGPEGDASAYIKDIYPQDFC